MSDEFLTTREAADLLKTSEATIRKECGNGRLPARKIGREWRIHRRVLMEWWHASADELRPVE